MAKEKQFSEHRSKVHCLDWCPDGSRLASGSTDASIRIWSLDRLLSDNNSGSNNSKISTEMIGHAGSIDQLAWSPSDMDILASVSADRTLKFWDTRNNSCIDTVAFADSENINLSWSDDGKLLAVSSKNDTLSIVDMRKNKKVMERRKFDVEINEMAWMPLRDKKSTSLLLTRGDGQIELVSYPGLKTFKSIPAHTSNCYCLQLTHDKKYFAVGSADAIVSLWDLEELACVKTFCRLDWPIRAISFSHDDHLIALASEDSYIDISKVENGELVCKLPVTAAINTLAWHPKEMILAYAGDHTDSRTNRSIGSIFLTFPKHA